MAMEARVIEVMVMKAMVIKSLEAIAIKSR
jgi:hypothetical protein